jgi:cell division protein FtsW
MQDRSAPIRIDPWILWPAILLSMIGLLMVTSASMVISERQYGYPFYYFARHLIYLCISCGAAAVVCCLPISFWARHSRMILLAVICLLVLVLIPGIGRTVNGSRRWIHLGFITIQVSEFAKLAMAIFMADYLARRHHEVIHHLSGFIRPLLVLSVVGVLLLGEPDFGATSVITIMVLGLLFMVGVRLWPFALMAGVVASIMTILAITSPYRMARITSFLNPWVHPFGSGYQLTQSLIAFGRGGFWGVGLGNSIQKLFYLPEAHTDFVYAVLAEELGVWGQLLVISLFAIFVGRGFVIGRRLLNHQPFAAYLSFALSIWIALQAMINIGVNAGVLPTKGLTLPFISYGGSSLLAGGIVVGLMLRLASDSAQASVSSRTRQRVHNLHRAW